ncbi:cGMP-dependent protein kinase 1-like [Penaeus vannamei]|uniref:cGMP-dependent protein kinase 1-like n=1 Tax=Penaeus vannamei TaxID=6689 RepID=UPI00387F64E7
MGSLELQELLSKKDDLIRHLESQLKIRDDEIMELRSQLDKFQSVMPYATGSSSSGGGKTQARKTRAQGISAEPQAMKTVQELNALSQTTFPEVAKSTR